MICGAPASPEADSSSDEDRGTANIATSGSARLCLEVPQELEQEVPLELELEKIISWG